MDSFVSWKKKTWKTWLFGWGAEFVDGLGSSVDELSFYKSEKASLSKKVYDILFYYN